MSSHQTELENGMIKEIRNHKMFSESDYEYFKSKGYTDDEILEIWDRDLANGGSPVIHQPIPDIVGLLLA